MRGVSGQCAQRGGVARQLLIEPKARTRHPHQWMEPQQRGQDFHREAPPRIATAGVGEFVVQDQSARRRVAKALHEIGGQQNARMRQRPDHRRPRDVHAHPTRIDVRRDPGEPGRPRFRGALHATQQGQVMPCQSSQRDRDAREPHHHQKLRPVDPGGRTRHGRRGLRHDGQTRQYDHRGGRDFLRQQRREHKHDRQAPQREGRTCPEQVPRRTPQKQRQCQPDRHPGQHPQQCVSHGGVPSFRGSRQACAIRQRPSHSAFRCG